VNELVLVVNADDLGYDPEIDRGILEAHRRGIVTSASAMVDTAHAAAALVSAPASLGVGLHAVLDPDLSAEEAEAEVRRQLGRFEVLRGTPTHLDSHKHAHAAPAVLASLAVVARERGLPVRAVDVAMRAALRARGVRTADHFLGDAALRPCWTPERLLAALTALTPGTTELMCHPGHPPSRARTSFGRERQVELAALCDPRARRAIEARGARLAGFDDPALGSGKAT
jgi:chitin disaccharide deacetylase